MERLSTEDYARSIADLDPFAVKLRLLQEYTKVTVAKKEIAALKLDLDLMKSSRDHEKTLRGSCEKALESRDASILVLRKALATSTAIK